jgi:hypothetical protein
LARFVADARGHLDDPTINRSRSPRRRARCLSPAYTRRRRRTEGEATALVDAWRRGGTSWRAAARSILDRAVTREPSA